MKILITGYGGYFATKLFKFFVDCGYEVFAISRRKENVADNIYIGDLTSELLYEKLPQNFDIIVHCAANTSHFASFNESYNDNYLATVKLVNHFNNFCDKFIFLSTEAVFLGKNLAKLDCNSTFDLNKNYSTYSLVKKISENFISSKAMASNSTEFIIARPRLIWGGDDCPAKLKIVNAMKKNFFFWVDKGEYFTSAVHYKNLCHGINQIIKYGKNNDKFFFTDRECIRFRDLVAKIVPEKSFKNVLSINRYIIFFVSILGSILIKISRGKVVIPLNLSVYYLTLSTVLIDQSDTIFKIHYEPKEY